LASARGGRRRLWRREPARADDGRGRTRTGGGEGVDRVGVCDLHRRRSEDGSVPHQAGPGASGRRRARAGRAAGQRAVCRPRAAVY